MIVAVAVLRSEFVIIYSGHHQIQFLLRHPRLSRPPLCMTDIIFWRLPNPSMNPTLSTDDPKEKLNDLMLPFPLPKVLFPCPKIDFWRLAYLLREVIQYININTSEQSKINNAINTPPSNSEDGQPAPSGKRGNECNGITYYLHLAKLLRRRFTKFNHNYHPQILQLRTECISLPCAVKW